MFDIDIRVATYQGIKLHRKDGTEYWKMRLTCTHEPCPNEVEMGECLCFGTEEAMVKARDNHGMHCSPKCWIADHTEEEVATELAKARKALRELPPDDRHLLEVYDMREELVVLDGYCHYVAEQGY